MNTKLCRPVLVVCEKAVKIGSIMKYIKKSCLLGTNINTLTGKLVLNGNEDVKTSNEYWQHQQLILISLEHDEKIREDDLYYFSKSKSIHKHLGILPLNPSSYDVDKCFKIIALQEQLSPEYIQQFIEEYNNNNIQDIEIEMTFLKERHGDSRQWIKSQPFPRLINGFVVIKEVLEFNPLYTKEEVIKLFLKLKKECILEYNAQITNINILEWLNENKKK